MTGEPSPPSGDPVGPLAPGSRLAGYRLEEQLGAGGMAVVYSAIDEMLGRRVALKVLAPGLAADAEFRQRFMRESRAATAVEDPHIIPVYGAGEAGGMLFIAMRFVSGGDLRSLMRREGPVTPARAVELISPVASALDAAHRVGLVHRDVKPGNVLVDTRPGSPDHVYLSDFGLSKSVTSTSGLTKTGQFLGTPDFAAPEQISGDTVVDGRADQYALACLAFELLAGSALFDRAGPIAVLWAHAYEPPPSLAAVRPDLPPAVDQVLGRALAKEPTDRFTSCQEFADALRAALGLPGYGVTSAPSPDIPQQAPEPAQEAPEPTEPSPEGTFDGQAEEATNTPAPPQLPQAPQPSQPPRRWRYRDLGIAAAAVALVAGITTAVVLNDNGGSRNADHPPAISSTAAGRTTAPHPTARSGVTSSAARGPNPSASASPSVHPLAVSVRRTAALLGGVEQGQAVAFSPDGKILATAYYDSTELWHASSHGRFATLTDVTDDVLHHVDAVAFSPDGATLAAADYNGNVYLWNVASQTSTATLRTTGAGPTGELTSVAFSPDGKLLAAGDRDGTARVWNAVTGTPVATLTDPSSQSVESVAFSPDSKTLVTGDGNGSAYLWNVAVHARIATLTDPAAPAAPNATGNSDVASVAFSPNGKILATGDRAEGTTYLWNLATRTRFAALPDPGTMTLTSVVFSPDGKLLAASDWNGSAYLWDVATGTRVAVATDPTFGVTHFVYALALSPNGKTLATQDGNSYTFLWQVTGG